jgi:hypothetical protein
MTITFFELLHQYLFNVINLI